MNFNTTIKDILFEVIYNDYKYNIKNQDMADWLSNCINMDNVVEKSSEQLNQLYTHTPSGKEKTVYNYIHQNLVNILPYIKTISKDRYDYIVDEITTIFIKEYNDDKHGNNFNNIGNKKENKPTVGHLWLEIYGPYDH